MYARAGLRHDEGLTLIDLAQPCLPSRVSVFERAQILLLKQKSYNLKSLKKNTT